MLDNRTLGLPSASSALGLYTFKLSADRFHKTVEHNRRPCYWVMLMTLAMLVGCRTSSLQPGERGAEVTAVTSSGHFGNLVTREGPPAIVVFLQPGCGHCGRLKKNLPSIAAQYPDNVRFLTVNTDNQSALSAQYEIRAVPTLLLLHRSEEFDRLVGNRPSILLHRRIRAFLKKTAPGR